MKTNEVVNWLMENPTEADKVRELLVPKEEHIRKVAELLAEDDGYIKSITANLPARQLMLIKHTLELQIFDREAKLYKL